MLQIGAKPVTASDSNGMIYDKDGIDLELLKEIKEVRRGRIKEYALEKKERGIHPNRKLPQRGECGVAYCLVLRLFLVRPRMN